MPPKSPRLRFPGHLVTAVLVSHDGSRWLPECLAALAAQRRPPQRVVAVDTGSDDRSVELLTAALGESAVLSQPRETAFATAVQVGLDAFEGAPAPPGLSGQAQEWVWVLHDDCAPEPAALDELLARAEESPSASVLGPKVVSWDRARLLEIGITVDGSGRRETGLEPREVDQGQHDDVTDVLAVGTAGMLVRREVWERLGGLDPTLALFGDDIDFGWRVNAAGGAVLIAPRAVVRHAAALTTGGRSPGAVTGSRRAAARHHGMLVVLANTGGPLVPLLTVRYLIEAVVRSLAALLLLRDPTHAFAEMLAVGRLVRRPRVVLSARRRRAATRARSYAELRHLLAPPSLRWRRFAAAVGTSLTVRRGDVERFRVRAPAETGPVPEEAESLTLDDAGVIRRALRRPGVALALGLTVAALIADRHLLAGTLQGGRLLPAPGGASDLWSTYLAAWHPSGLGSTVVAPAYLAVLALLSTVLLGKVWLAVSVLLLGAVPLAGLSAYLAARRFVPSWRLRVWLSILYALAPAVTGAVAGGRLDVVVVAVLLPLVARAAAAALAVDTARVGWHRSAGAGLLLAVVAAFAPVVWLVAVPVLLAGAAFGSGPATRRRRVAAAVALLAVAPVVLFPWTARLVLHPALLVAGAGLPDSFHGRDPAPAVGLLLAHPGGPAQPPLWVWAPVVLAAIAGLARGRGQRLARVGVFVFACGLAAAIVVSRLAGSTPDVSAPRFWTGAPLVIAVLGALLAASVAADSAIASLTGHSFGWRQPAAALVAAAAVAGTATSVVVWIGRGADGPLTSGGAGLLPVFVSAEAARPTSPRVLTLRAVDGVVHYALVRTATGPRLGDADVDAGSAADASAARSFAAAVRDAAAGRARAAGELAEFGITLVVIPADSAPALARVAAVTGFAQVPATASTVLRASAFAGELVVLPPAAKVGGASAAPQPLPASLGSARTTVPAGPPGRLLVLAEPAARAWTASLGGRRLMTTTAYGWAQAWVLPPEGGRLVVGRTDGGWLRWPTLELVLVLVVAMLAVPNRRLARTSRADGGGR
jgi:GT2 family glycosyltransferase